MPSLKQFAHGLFPANTQRAEDLAVALEETSRERAETDAALRTFAPVAVPEELQLRLRLTLSHERVRAERRWSGRIAHRWHLVRENTLSRVALSGAVMATAVLLLVGAATTLGAFTPQQAVEANDIPLAGFSAPRYLYSSAGAVHPIASVDQVPLTVEAKVSSGGRVYSYRVLSGSLDAETETALRERMLSSVFRPADFFGERVRGTVVLTFTDVNVRG